MLGGKLGHNRKNGDAHVGQFGCNRHFDLLKFFGPKAF
jgi:hypothetical protein